MFVMTKRFRRNPKSYFYDKSFPMGSNSERAVHPILDCLVNPKGKLAYKIIYSMTKNENFVTDDAVCITVTPAQQQLLQLLSHTEAKDYLTALKNVHYLGTYCVSNDMLEPWQHGYVHQIIDALQAISTEQLINLVKTASA